MNDDPKFKMQTESYAQQVRRWPNSGQHILAQYDDKTILVYQAYRPAIGHFTAKNGDFRPLER